MSYTPGPWIMDIDLQIADVITPDRELLATAFPMRTPRGKSYEIAEANARMIAAAPDMLAALQGVLRVADRKTDEFDAARAAITKATGAQS